MTLLRLPLCYATLWLVVWLHEVGHGLLYRLFGCKRNPLRVQTPPWLLFSSPAPVDRERADQLPPRKAALIHYGGVFANVLCALAVWLVLRFGAAESRWLLLFLWSFLTLHLNEAACCLLLGSLYPADDMAYAVRACGALRYVNLAAGVALAAGCVVMLRSGPTADKLLMVVFNIVGALCWLPGRLLHGPGGERHAL